MKISQKRDRSKSDSNHLVEPSKLAVRELSFVRAVSTA
jgi:hypothetical protein